MRYIINDSTDPYYNLALEEYCLKNVNIDEDYFILWQNEPSIIIGKYQNTIEEINSKFVHERRIKVARRISGGGAVYHDFGNLNFTFVSKIDDIEKVNFKKYSDPIIEALSIMGVKAELTGRNDITIDGKKISGNAQYMHNKRLLHHGTLLYDVNIENLVNALNVKADKITSKGIKSVRSRVTNIKEHLPSQISLMEFKNIIYEFLSSNGNSEEIILNKNDYKNITKLRDEKFKTWQWNYGESPSCNMKSEKRFPGGKLEIVANINNSIIKEIRFYGDFLGLKQVEEVEKKLIGVKYDRNEIREKLKTVSLKEYFGTITLQDVIELLFG